MRDSGDIDPADIDLGRMGPAGIDPDNIDLDDIDSWVAGARTAEAARSRARRHWMRRQASEEATLAGTLVSLAERATEVVISTSHGARHRGRIIAVGADYLEVAPATGREVLLARSTVVAIGTPSAIPETIGDRDTVPTGDWAERLVDLVGTDVAVITRDGGNHRGRLLGVGQDLLTIRSGPDGSEFVPLAAVAEVTPA